MPSASIAEMMPTSSEPAPSDNAYRVMTIFDMPMVPPLTSAKSMKLGKKFFSGVLMAASVYPRV